MRPLLRKQNVKSRPHSAKDAALFFLKSAMMFSERRDGMDWLNGLNQAVEYMEENLTGAIIYEDMARMVGCSVYEFSRVFSFVAGVPVSEYIRRRRLTQAAFDLRQGKGKVIDIALKFGYDSPSAFARAFKELHGAAPSAARRENVPLKTYPPISFLLTIRGENAMEFRIEKMDAFQIVGLSGWEDPDCGPDDALTPLWREFMDHYNPRLYNGGGPDCLYSKPFCQVAAYSFRTEGGRMRAMIGAEYKGVKPEGMTVESVPAATWAVFPITSPTGYPHVPKAYTRILTEWFPQSGWRRDEKVSSLEVYPAGDAQADGYVWEIWMPVTEK